MAFQQAIDTGHPVWAGNARFALATVLVADGDPSGAHEQYQRLVELGDERWGADALDSLIPQLRGNGDPRPSWTNSAPVRSPQHRPHGRRVLSRGLPELPEQLSYLMAVPVAYWTARHRAVVLFLQFDRHGREHLPGVLHVTYTPTDTSWTADRHFMGTSFSHDPIARPGSQRDLGGRAMVTGGGTNTITHGLAVGTPPLAVA